MAQFYGFGNGKDGLLTISSNTTEAPVDSSCSGSSGGSTLVATNASFQDDDMVLIHQSRGTGVGSWELNFIDTYAAGNVSMLFPLSNTYTDSGASQAQVREVPEYTGVTVNIGVSYTPKTWDGDVGGILFFLCSGHVQVNGVIHADGKGYRGNTTRSYSKNGGSADAAWTGEGTVGASVASGSANGSGGAGGGGGDAGSGGGGGGHAATGGTGEPGQSSSTPGGTTSGSADMTTMTFGGGGGSGRGESNANCVPSNTYYGGNGGNGGGIIGIFANSLAIGASGFIRSNGADGENSNGGCEEGAGGGGGGAGGSIFLVFAVGTIGAGQVLSNGGVGGDGTGSFDADGGTGSVGRIRIEGCEIDNGYSTTPSASVSLGGHDYCQSFIHIYG